MMGDPNASLPTASSAPVTAPAGIAGADTAGGEN